MAGKLGWKMLANWIIYYEVKLGWKVIKIMNLFFLVWFSYVVKWCELENFHQSVLLGFFSKTCFDCMTALFKYCFLLLLLSHSFSIEDGWEEIHFFFSPIPYRLHCCRISQSNHRAKWLFFILWTTEHQVPFPFKERSRILWCSVVWTHLRR